MSAPHDDDHDVRACLSSLEWDCLIAGELEDKKDVQDHLGSCPICQKKRDDYIEKHRKWVADIRANQKKQSLHAAFMQEQKLKKSNKKAMLFAGITALAAAITFMLVFPQLADTENQDVSGRLRTKGSNTVKVYLLDKNTARLYEGAPILKPNDTLVFRITSLEVIQVMLVAIGGHGSAYFIEQGGQRAWTVKSGVDSELPVSVVLDNEPFDERIFVLFCKNLPSERHVIEEINKNYPESKQQAGRRIKEARPLKIDGCDAKSIQIRRQKRNAKIPY